MSISKVSSELLEDALDIIAGCNGIRSSELASALGVGPSSATAIVRELLKFNCISKGAVQYFKKDGEVSLHTGHYYEQDLPVGYKTPNRRQTKKKIEAAERRNKDAHNRLS